MELGEKEEIVLKEDVKPKKEPEEKLDENSDEEDAWLYEQLSRQRKMNRSAASPPLLTGAISESQPVRPKLHKTFSGNFGKFIEPRQLVGIHFLQFQRYYVTLSAKSH